MDKTTTGVMITAVLFMIFKVTFRQSMRNKIEKNKYEKDPAVIAAKKEQQAKAMIRKAQVEAKKVSGDFLSPDFTTDFDVSKAVTPDKVKMTGDKEKDNLQIILDAVKVRGKKHLNAFMNSYKLSNEDALYYLMEAGKHSKTYNIMSPHSSNLELFNVINRSLQGQRLPVILTDCEFVDLSVDSKLVESEDTSNSVVLKELINLLEANNIVLLDLGLEGDNMNIFAISKDKYDRFMQASTELGLSIRKFA